MRMLLLIDPGWPATRKLSGNGLPESDDPLLIPGTIESCGQDECRGRTSYFAFSSSTRAVAKGMTASSSTGVRAALFETYSVKDASFISTPLSNTRIAIFDAV